MANALGELFSNIANAIRDKTGSTETMKPIDFPIKIAEIEGGGGSSADVRYVTFMSHDDAIEYGKKAVAVGDDCADPIARGIFGTPIRESTAQYSYTFAGWSTVANGGLDATALKKVTEDRTVYANYVATVRYYTITYYDGDTVLKTESLAYGATPTYMPEKDGYSFDGWLPQFEPVTGNASYHAQWSEALTFAGASWADIARISENGEASQYFKIGDSKEIPITYTDGSTDTITVAIAGFDHDTLPDGNTAGMSLVCTTLPNYMVPWTKLTYSSNMHYPYVSTNTSMISYVRTVLQSEVLQMLPAEVQAVIKPVIKKSDMSPNNGTTPYLYETEETLWCLSLDEMGHNNDNPARYTNLGKRYELFKPGNLLAVGVLDGVRIGSTASIAPTYWTRQVSRLGSWQIIYISNPNLEKPNGGSYATYDSPNAASLNQTNRHIRFGFCI